MKGSERKSSALQQDSPLGECTKEATQKIQEMLLQGYVGAQAKELVEHIFWGILYLVFNILSYNKDLKD